MLYLNTGRLVWLLMLVVCVAMALSGCNSSNDDEGIVESGYYTVVSDGVEREFYIQLPTNYQRGGEALPLLIAIHGSGDSIQGWMKGGFQGDGLLQLAASGAIMVIPNGLIDATGKRNWDATSDRDYNFFLDLLAALDQKITYDDKRIWVTGHSAGALMTHGLGCRYGDIFRAIAPSAGSITDLEFSCNGALAVMQIQGRYDEIQTLSVVTQTRDDWAQYNGYDKTVYADTDPSPCVDYSGGSLTYPVYWCLHSARGFRGHAWWSGADQAIWNFFNSLDVVEPGMEPPPNGGNDKVVRDLFPTTANLTITIEFPDGLGEPIRTGLFLYPAGSTLPIVGAPLEFLQPDVDFGDISPGIRTLTIPVQVPASIELPGTYTIVLAAYIFGSFPIPEPGIDHNLLYEYTFTDRNTDIVIPGVQPLLPVQP